jgi:uncharacterized repeat protein (TIGR02543 family)
MKRLFTTFLLGYLVTFFIVGPAWAAPDTHTAASCENKAGQLDVQTAMDAAASGDTVTIPAGSCTWTTTVTNNNKSLIIQGAGVGTTNITANVGTGFNATAIRNIVPTSGKTIEISGISWTATATPPEGIIYLKGAGNVIKVHDCAFTNWYTRAIWIEGVATYGAIYKNTFTQGSVAGTQQAIFYREGADDAESDTAWATAVTWNSANYLFIEGNTFTLNKELDGLTDCENGAKVVWQYNTGNGTHGGGPLGGHGYDSINRSCMARVIRNNSFSNSSSIPYGVQLRGGTAVIYSNRFSGTYSTGALSLTNMRSCDGCTVCNDGRTKDICDGVTEGFTGELVDGNTSPVGTYRGWPCRDQVGRSGGTDGQVSQPVYQWDNLNGATPITGTVYNSASGTCYTSTHIQADRDYFNATDAADAASKGLTFTAPACPSTYADPGATGYCNPAVAGTTGYNLEAGGDPVPYAMTPTVTGEGCAISPAVATAVAAGETQAFTVTVGAGYHITTLSGCGGTLSGSTFTSAVASEDCGITLACRSDKGSMTLSSGAGTGSMTLGSGAGSGTFCFNSATLTYAANEATSGAVPSADVYCPGMTSTVKANTGTLARTGYTFDGWNTAADGSGTDRAASSTFTISGNVTLYAKWEVLPFSPSDISGLLVWYSASDIEGLNDGDAVATWDDLVGTKDLTQATADYRPLYKTNIVNGHPALLFDKTNDFLLTADTITGMRTIIVVAKYTAATFDRFDGLLTAGTNYVYIGYSGQTYFFADLGTYYQDGVEANTNVTNAWHVFMVKRGGDYISAALQVGKDRTEANRFWGGYVAEVLAYDSNLTGDDFTNIHAYMKAKYGTP